MPCSVSLQVVRRVPTGDVVLTEVVLSWSGRMLFAGGTSGCVRSLKFPLTEAGEFSEHQAHSAPVTRVSGVGQFSWSFGWPIGLLISQFVGHSVSTLVNHSIVI